MVHTSLLKKLRLKPGQRILLLNPPGNFLVGLGELPKGMKLDSTPVGEYDAVILFVQDVVVLDKFMSIVMNAIKYDGLLWITYPKISSKEKTDLSRDILWKKMAGTNWRPVTQISVDEVWSAMRFRPIEAVRK